MILLHIDLATANDWDRALLQSLYEEWLSGGQDWTRTSTYINMMESSTVSKRGKYVFRTLKELKEKYGAPVALDIKQRKLEQEAARKPGEEAFWLKHPEVPDDEDWFGIEFTTNLCYGPTINHEMYRFSLACSYN